MHRTLSKCKCDCKKYFCIAVLNTDAFLHINNLTCKGNRVSRLENNVRKLKMLNKSIHYKTRYKCHQLLHLIIGR